MVINRQYDNSNLQKRSIQRGHKSVNLQQQSGIENTGIQPKPRQREMVHVPEQREPAPITKVQPREPQRDNWYRDDWFSRQDNTWQQGAQRGSGYMQYGREYGNRRRSPSPERGWEVDLGGGGGYYRYISISIILS